MCERTKAVNKRNVRITGEKRVMKYNNKKTQVNAYVFDIGGLNGKDRM